MRSVSRAFKRLLLGALFIPVATIGQVPLPTQNAASPRADPQSFPKEAIVIEDLQIIVRFASKMTAPGGGKSTLALKCKARPGSSSGDN